MGHVIKLHGTFFVVKREKSIHASFLMNGGRLRNLLELKERMRFSYLGWS